MSLYIELFEYLTVYDGNDQAFLIDLIIRSHINIIQERADVSHGFY